MYNKSDITALGMLTAETLNPKNDERYLIEYLIVSRGLNPLLGARTIQQLHLMNINEANIMSMDTEDRKKVLTQSDIADSYAHVFAGEGALEGKQHLEIDECVPPVKLPVRKVPIAVRGQLKEELDRLSAMGIIEPVDVPTDWISFMVVTTKRNRKLRLCIDPKPLNQALKRNHYPSARSSQSQSVKCRRCQKRILARWTGHWEQLPHDFRHPMGSVQVAQNALWYISSARGIPKKTGCCQGGTGRRYSNLQWLHSFWSGRHTRSSSGGPRQKADRIPATVSRNRNQAKQR